MRFWFITLFIFIPTPSLAAVLINEVAWMGSAASANHEWIELHNTGEAVNVDGWILSDGMNLSITLVGNIPANSYAVLERTSDESVTGPAFLIYTGAIINTGATLVLKRSDGGIEDQVAGGENWQSIGGDNVTKETAQFTTSGWITAAATPGRVNQTIGSQPAPVPTPTPTPSPSNENNPPTNQSQTTSNKSNSSETVRFILPANSLKLTVDAQTKGFVNQEIFFAAEPIGIGRNLAHSVVYRWNFGDGTVGFGKSPTHHYTFPGTYVVTIFATVGTQEHLSRHEITILPITLSVTKNAQGDIQVNNDSPYEIDISGYTVSGTDDFVFPPYSIMLPNQTITLPKQKVARGNSTIIPKLMDSLSQIIPIKKAPSASLAAASIQTNDDTILTPLARPQVNISQSTAAPARPFGFATTTVTAPVTTIPPVSIESPPVEPLVITPPASTTKPAPRWPYLAFIALLLGCLAAIFYKPKSVTNFS
jgi:hypothetical protein